MNFKERAIRKAIWITVSFAFIGIAVFLVPKTATAISLTGNALTNLKLVNQTRAGIGLNELNWNERLAVAASEKANDMVARDYFAHTSPEGVKAWNYILEAGYDYRYAGENLAIDFSKINDAQTAWEQSPTHRANILGSQFTDFGFAEATGEVDGRETTVFVQLFGQK
jgi:uncharacterized protein YkwD